jgi:hypothetical protein
MKKLILFIFLAVGSHLMASAQFQEQKSPSERASSLSQVLQKQLNLSPHQTSKVNTILNNQNISLDSLLNISSGLDKKEVNKSRKFIIARAAMRLDSVFTDEQKSAYSSFIQQQKDKKAARKNGGFGTPFQN